MKKHLIAAAVASAMAVPAVAQVTISGNVDTGYNSRAVKDGGVETKTTTTGFANRNATSTINFQATEDLGKGLKATAFINQALDATNGSLVPRDIWTSIGGGFGEVKIGRFAPAFETVTGAHNVTGTVNSAGTIDWIYGSGAHSGTAFGPEVAYADVGRGLRTHSATSASLPNAGSTIQYASPLVNGMQVTLGFGQHTIDSAGTAGKAEVEQLDAALSYSAGPVSFGLAVVQRKDTANDGLPATTAAQTEGTVSNDIDLLGFGISYRLGSMTLKAGMITREEQLSNASTKRADASVTSIGLTMPMGANTLTLNYYDGDDSADGTAANKREHSGYQLGVTNALSKRTAVYAIYGKDEKKANAIANTTERTDVTIGLRHAF